MTTDSPSIYRLDRRFVLQPVGLLLLAAAVALALPMVFDRESLALAGWLVAFVLVGRAIFLWWRPAIVARLSPTEAVIGGALTVKHLELVWTDVEQVALAGSRVTFDRGSETLVLFPLALVGKRAPEFVRDVYDRLNTAHGYQRFDPNSDSGPRPD